MTSPKTGTSLPPLRIGHVTVPLPIIQGGMGVGISTPALASAVSREGGLGTLSSVCLDLLVGLRVGRTLTQREAVRIEVEQAKENGLPVAINIMVAAVNSYEDSVLGAMDGGVDVIVSGAGLPLQLPSIVAKHPRSAQTELVPIVSSGRAAELLCKRWMKSGRAPAAMIVEGPEAGGHLGWKTAAEVADPTNRLENLLVDVVKVSRANGDFPVIAAGGVYTHEDILKMLSLGASGVQLGTRFLATEESGACPEFKRAVVESKPEDILVAVTPGSPCGLPFRILRQSSMLDATTQGVRCPRCDKGYLLINGKCVAINDPTKYFCICNGLLSAAGYVKEGKNQETQLYTVGSAVSRVDRILTVKELMRELAEG